MFVGWIADRGLVCDSFPAFATKFRAVMLRIFLLEKFLSSCFRLFNTVTGNIIRYTRFLNTWFLDRCQALVINPVPYCHYDRKNLSIRLQVIFDET
jgi:hypothetical protein